MVTGGGRAVVWGSLEKKLGTGGPRGMVGATVGSVFGAGGVAHRQPWAAGGCGLAGGGWRLRVVQVEDELQALPKLHVKCLSATIAFSFDSSIQIPQ